MNSTLGSPVEQAGRHLAPAGVINTDEEDLRDVFLHSALRLGKGSQPLTSETVDKDGHKLRSPRSRQSLERFPNEAGDSRFGEYSPELFLETLHAALNVPKGDRILARADFRKQQANQLR